MELPDFSRVREISFWDAALLLQQVGLMPKFGPKTGK